MPKEKSVPTSPKTFVDWLKSVPSLEDVNEEEITINIPVMLSADQWLLIAHVAAKHSETLDETVISMIEDVCLDDRFMNEREHLSETRHKDDEERDRRMEEKRKHEKEEQDASRELLEDVESADWWKKKTEEGSAQ
jgi:hypothetical protein